MSQENSVIRSIIKPEIKLDDIILDDLFTGTSDELGDQKGVKGRQYQKDLGTKYPILTINGYVFKDKEILDFTLDSTGFIPTVRFKVALVDSAVFKSQSMPKDGDIVSIFIRAKNDAFKPIRNDYLITNINDSGGGIEGRGSNLLIEGELYIKNLRDEIIESFEGTSFDVLKKVAQKVKLGFATNESSTSDSQNWICAGDNLFNFIKHVTDHSWKDEQSFYDCYIDVYYHLNFINVNAQVEGEDKLNAAILDLTAMKDFNSDDNLEEGSQQQTKKLLTDMASVSGTNMYIKSYRVINNSSEISRRYGYRSFVQFFDQKSGKTWDIFVDPIVSEGSADKKILLKGRAYPKKADGTAEDDSWLTQNKKYWLGVQYRDVHDKYLYSELWNKRNREELNKMYIEANIERWNPNVYRGEKLPVIIITQDDTMKRVADATPNETSIPANETPAVADQFYSGFYMVSGMKIMYSMAPESTNNEDPPKQLPPNLYQIFRLTRREWPVPATG